MQIRALSGCGCSHTLGAANPVQLPASSSAYVFFLDTTGYTSSSGGPYTVVSVPWSYYGVQNVPLTNPPTDSPNVGNNTFAITWSGSMDASGNNVTLFDTDGGTQQYPAIPPMAQAQAQSLAQSAGAPVFVGILNQSTPIGTFMNRLGATPTNDIAVQGPQVRQGLNVVLSPAGPSGPVAPIISPTAAPVSQPSIQTVQATSSNGGDSSASYSDAAPSLIVGTQNPGADGGQGAPDVGLSNTDILLIGAVVLLLLRR